MSQILVLIVFSFFSSLIADGEEPPNLKKKLDLLSKQLKTEASIDTKILASMIKSLGLYEDTSLHFGSWGREGYLNPLPFDLEDNRRYFILRFKIGFQISSMLFEIEWDEEAKGKYHEMLWIQSSFYTDDIGRYKITRFYLRPWDNQGNLLVKDLRLKKQDPASYWRLALPKAEPQR